ncbi:hypothetical protein B0H14DRAFT_3163754 [Mycena olivaceomarginata]|nr:hypothetical protein B0H14DRAFT_3163754 [Mycena olivaceomarginata]
MGALGKELFAFGKPDWLIPFAMYVFGPFHAAAFLSCVEIFRSKLAKFMKYLNLPIILLYIGWLPYSVNGQWTSCMIIGVYSQWWLRTRRPKWFAKVSSFPPRKTTLIHITQYNYILSAALDGGSQVILFILSFAVFGARGKAIMFPSWWGNYYKIVGLVGQDREDTDLSSSKRTPPKRNAGFSQVIDDRRAPQYT